jgi:hypothetical protein
MENKKTLLKEMKKKNKRINEVLFSEVTYKTLVQHFSLPIDFNSNKTRKREYVYARQIGMYLMSKQTNFTLVRIGIEFGNKDHATVLHSKRTINDLMDSSKKIKEEIKSLENLILYKIKVITEKKNADDSYYYINFDNYTSVRFSDDKGILLTGFKSYEVFSLLKKLTDEHLETREHNKTGYYILEKQTEL